MSQRTHDLATEVDGGSRSVLATHLRELRVATVPVIDCDSHVMEPADLWQKYLEPKYRDRAIRIEEKDGQETSLRGI